MEQLHLSDNSHDGSTLDKTFCKIMMRITSNFTEGGPTFMANKINVKLILELKASGLSRNQIAASRHMSKHSFSDVINIAKEKEITYEKVRYLSEEEVYRMIFPDKFAVENLYEQPDYEYAHQELKRVDVTLKLLWQEY